MKNMLHVLKQLIVCYKKEKLSSPPACHLGPLEKGQSGVRMKGDKWKNLSSGKLDGTTVTVWEIGLYHI